MQRQRAHCQALPLSLALENALLDKLKAGARLALHPPQPSVPHIRVIEAACSKQGLLCADHGRSWGCRPHKKVITSRMC